jgi:hypothetical protein
MGKTADAWSAAVEYASTVAGIGAYGARDRGVPPDRVALMRAFIQLLRQADEDAFYVVVETDYALNSAQAVAECLSLRAEAEIEKEALQAPSHPPIGDDDPTPVTP